MSYKLLDGKDLAARMKKDMLKEVEELTKAGIFPGLAVVIVGNDPASRIYVNSKKRDCEEVGIKSFEYSLPEQTSEEELLGLIDALNQDPAVDGILVQLPLPKHLDEAKVIRRINSEKDVDAFHPYNVGELMIGRPVFAPCTPAGVMELIKDAGLDVAGKNCVVVGRSNIVGKPMAMLMLHDNATVTICHSKTKDLKAVCKEADILIAAIGRANYITADYVKEGAIVIDVGMNRNSEGKVTGDVDFPAICEKASAITPVPGGVGPMTRAMLLKNTIKACNMHKNYGLS
ncbi:MAG: bifunctional methylenetetrahydrofolate dehydrogenase/methenyltetrahydrofolate cyclohydrolase FolD [Acetivibrionales bacterium]|jgi:methylenetetrahydrofolate dehydrogenase (NADP+)/methenyltetrahydrofolate cyclohydrolase|nr:bifunctional methylenetetrahydrofolate dehydrogenase/methenyltetrahydrofolate cyclohydrolase FolD [Clostridiaceae bacterium]